VLHFLVPRLFRRVPSLSIYQKYGMIVRNPRKTTNRTTQRQRLGRRVSFLGASPCRLFPSLSIYQKCVSRSRQRKSCATAVRSLDISPGAKTVQKALNVHVCISSPAETRKTRTPAVHEERIAPRAQHATRAAFVISSADCATTTSLL